MSKHISAIVAAAVLALAPSALAQVQANVEITPEQQAYQARTDARIRAWIHEDNHDATEEERTFINDHWRRAAPPHPLPRDASARHGHGRARRRDPHARGQRPRDPNRAHARSRADHDDRAGHDRHHDRAAAAASGDAGPRALAASPLGAGL